jgi:uroporphyrinogen-III decarboxylase
MTHKERLLTAIRHEEPDRVPICAWYTPEAERKMLDHLGVASQETVRLRTAGQGGRLILAPAHNIQPEVLLENVLAFYEAARQHGRYPLQR